MDTTTFDIVGYANAFTTKDAFKKELRSKLASMEASDDPTFQDVMRQIGRYNPIYVEHNGDGRPIQYCNHPIWPQDKTICILVDGTPISVGWNCAIDDVWKTKKLERKRSRTERTMVHPFPPAISSSALEGRGPGQLFDVAEDGLFARVELTSVQSCQAVHRLAEDAVKKYDVSPPCVSDSLIGVSVALNDDGAVRCLYVFQKRWKHSNFQNYRGSFENNPIVVREFKKASSQLVLDVAFVVSGDAHRAEAAVYRVLVKKYGPGVVPQLPVNGEKVVEMSDDQEVWLAYLDSNHPCRPLLDAGVDEAIFSRDVGETVR